MKLNKKIVITIVLLITTALIGLITLQIYLLNHAIKLETQIFQQNVNAALSNIVQKLETNETLTKILKVSVDLESRHKPPMAMIALQHTDSTSMEDEIFSAANLKMLPKIYIDSNKVVFNLDTKQHVYLRILDSLGREISKPIDEVKPAGKHEVELWDSKSYKGSYHLNFISDSTTYFMKIVDGRSCDLIKNPARKEKKRRIVEKVFNDLTFGKPAPITSRINPAMLDSILNVTLLEKGIQMPYAYGIVRAANDSLIIVKPKKLNADIRFSKYKTRLFPHDLFAEKNDLVLHFPNQKMYLFKQSTLLAFSSLTFILIIIFCFIYVIRAILKQKKFSNLLVDFINNMTHEFKTPISTISLAGETIKNPAVLNDKNKLLRYGNIISDESTRMRNQVEKILQMAALESGEFELNLGHVNVHKLIEEAIEKFTLKIEKRDGKIITKLEASTHLIEADAVHFGNMIYNLLDNAEKYSRQNPEILVTTENLGQQLKISISDNGIGLKPEEQKRIFDKYYRVPTGNIHDVKGFGLGLSYVKLIVNAHHGNINLISVFGKGSVFEIYLLVKQNY